jgi:dynein heavy chain
MFEAILNNRVPPNWQTMAYPSLKKLGSWILDLQKRVNFMREWATKGHPHSFWLSGFFFPHGFITGVLQTYARKYQQPIDQLQLKFEIKEWTSPEDVKSEPREGVYIYGLFLENARWSKSKSILIEARPGEMSFLMPIIHFKPKVLASAK